MFPTRWIGGVMAAWLGSVALAADGAKPPAVLGANNPVDLQAIGPAVPAAPPGTAAAAAAGTPEASDRAGVAPATVTPSGAVVPPADPAFTSGAAATASPALLNLDADADARGRGAAASPPAALPAMPSRIAGESMPGAAPESAAAGLPADPALPPAAGAVVVQDGAPAGDLEGPPDPVVAIHLDEPAPAPAATVDPGERRLAGRRPPSTPIIDQAGSPWSWVRREGGLLPLAVVLAAVVGAALLFKRFARRGGMSPTSGIEVLSKTHLSPKQSLSLVRVGARVFLLGVTSEQITHLGTIDDPLEIDVLQAGARSRSQAHGRRTEEFDTHLDRESDDYSGLEETPLSEDEPDYRRYGRTRRSLDELVAKVQSMSTAHASR